MIVSNDHILVALEDLRREEGIIVGFYQPTFQEVVKGLHQCLQLLMLLGHLPVKVVDFMLLRTCV